jgi:hypothetical protein
METLEEVGAIAAAGADFDTGGVFVEAVEPVGGVEVGVFEDGQIEGGLVERGGFIAVAEDRAQMGADGHQGSFGRIHDFMRNLLLLLAVLRIEGTGIAPDFVLAKQARPKGEVRGAGVVSERELWSWGERLERWELPGLKRKTLGTFETREGGCVVDVDGDGRMDVVAPTREGLAWFRAPRWERVVMDAEAETFECVGVELLGRRGVLVVHMGMQLRFYERPAAGGTRWPYREIYSFYTASHQGGLLVEDVDGDGRVDVLCGNYWVRSPAAFELPWTLYAINTWSEQAESAWASLARMGDRLLWAESRMSGARVGLFRQPEDARVLWDFSVVEMTPRALAKPRVAAWGGQFFVLGEDAGAASRLMTFTARGEGRILERGEPVRQVLPVRAGFAVVNGRRVAFYKKVPR